MSWPDATETDRRAGVRLTETIERIQWRLWHGQVKRALDLIAETAVIVDAAAEDLPAAATAARKRLRDGPPTRRADFDGGHREHSAMAAASANECPAANEVVSAGRSFDAQKKRARNPRKAAIEVIEMSDIGQQLADDEHCPAVGKELRRASDRTVLAVNCTD